MFYKLDFIKYLRVDENLPKIILFSGSINIFLLGISFTMGILFVQFLPKNYYLQLLHSAIWMFFFQLMLQIARQNGMIDYIYWKRFMYFNAIPINMLALACINNILNERRLSIKNGDVKGYTVK